MKKCKYCMQEIDQKATVCPFCRRRQNTFLLVRFIICFVVVLLLWFSVFGDMLNANLPVYASHSNFFGILRYSGTIRNNGRIKRNDIKISVRCVDDNDVVVLEQTKTINSIYPGESADFEVSVITSDAKNVTCKSKIKSNIFRFLFHLFD